MKVQLDASARTFVWVCDCGARGLEMNRGRAWEAARRHELRAHPGHRDTINMPGRHADTTR